MDTETGLQTFCIDIVCFGGQYFLQLFDKLTNTNSSLKPFTLLFFLYNGSCSVVALNLKALIVFYSRIAYF